MRCKSCKEDVPPKFVHAISVNVCPLCGQEIMDAKLQTILNDLKSIMDKTTEYSGEVSDWLFSNYGLKTWDTKEEIPKTVEPATQAMHNRLGANRFPTEHIDEVESPEEVSIFAKRAGLKASNFKRVIEHIQGAADPSEFKGVDDEYGTVGNNENELSAPLDSRGKKEIMSIFREDDAKNLELEKLKKLRSQATTSNGGGKFWRTS